MIYKAMWAVTATHVMTIMTIYLVQILKYMLCCCRIGVISVNIAISNMEIRQNTVFIKQKKLYWPIMQGLWLCVKLLIYIYIFLSLLKFNSKFDSRSNRRELSIDGWWSSFPFLGKCQSMYYSTIYSCSTSTVCFIVHFTLAFR